MSNELVINTKRCTDVVKRLDEYFKNDREIANIDYPSNIKYGTNMYLLYMFYSCLLDYGMRSIIYHKNLVNTYNNYPNIFNPNIVINMDYDSLKDIIINNVHPRYPNVAVDKWINLSNVLANYDNIYDYLSNIKSFDKLNSFIKSIKGYGQKTGGLLIRIICDAHICKFSEVACIPIDRHDIEISYLTGVINSKKVNSKDIENISNTYVSASKKLGISPSDIDKYLWEIGNSFCNKRDCINCPLNVYCLNYHD